MKSLSKRAFDATRFFTLSLHQQWLLVRVFIVLSVYKCLLLIFPLNQFINSANRPSSPGRDIPLKTLNNIVWAIQVLSNQLPLGFTCLVQALTAKWLFGNHPDVRVYIGVRKDEKRAFSAHAWVMYKGKTILGEQPDQAFKPILSWR